MKERILLTVLENLLDAFESHIVERERRKVSARKMPDFKLLADASEKNAITTRTSILRLFNESLDL